MFINAVGEVTRERAQNFFTDDHIEHIVNAYEKFNDEPGFTRVATLEEIRAKDGNLSIPRYVAPQSFGTREERADYAANGLPDALSAWLASSQQVRAALNGLLGGRPGTPQESLKTRLVFETNIGNLLFQILYGKTR